MAWKRDENLIAERFRKEELPGFLTKEFDAKGDEFIVLEKNREIYLEKDHGKLSISNLMENFTDILMVDKSEKTLENEIKNVCLSDGRDMGIKLTIKFRVLNSDHFSKNMMGERKKLFLDDIWNEMISDVLCKKVIPKLQKRPSRDFSGGESKERTKSAIETEIKRKFREWGLMIISLYVNFSIPEEAAECIASEDEELEKTEKPVKPGMTLEEETEELEKERLEREVVMELEKKQMQKDVEEAMEAMELKDIQGRRKMFRESETREEERGELEKELEDLKRAKEITERKFYKKELSEESFQRMIEEFEKRIIEIETKLRDK